MGAAFYLHLRRCHCAVSGSELSRDVGLTPQVPSLHSHHTGLAMNEFEENKVDTPERTVAERHIEAVRQQGGLFVEAVRRTRMPMLVTDATLPGNPIVFANQAFVDLSGYSMDELLGQDPHFMNGAGTDPEAIRRYEASITDGRDETLEILQYRKDGAPFRAMLFASPVDDGQGTVTNHFLSYLDITRRYVAEEDLRTLASELEARVATRTRDLEAVNTRLSALVSEREMLLVEVNHRAKNSLAIAASLLAIQGRRQPDPAVRALFEEAHDRLNAMARVHDLLSKSEQAQRVDVSVYVADLCGALRPITETMIASVSKRRWTMRCWWTPIRQFRWASCSPSSLPMLSSTLSRHHGQGRSSSRRAAASRDGLNWSSGMMGSGCRVCGKDHSGMAWFGLSSSRSGVRSTCAVMRD